MKECADIWAFAHSWEGWHRGGCGKFFRERFSEAGFYELVSGVLVVGVVGGCLSEMFSVSISLFPVVTSRRGGCAGRAVAFTCEGVSGCGARDGGRALMWGGCCNGSSVHSGLWSVRVS